MRLNENKFIGGSIIKICYPEEEQRLSESGELPMIWLDLLGQSFVHPHQLMYLPFGVLPAGVLPSVVFPALAGEMVLAASGLLEKKGRTPLELEIPEEEGELPLSGVSFQLWYSWRPSSLAGWTGGHRHLGVWLLPRHWFAAVTRKSL